MTNYEFIQEILNKTKKAIASVDNFQRKTEIIEEVSPTKKEFFLSTREKGTPPKKIKVNFIEPINGWFPLENVGIKMPDKKFGTAEIRVGKLVRMTTEKAVIVLGGIYSNEEIISVSPNNLIKINDAYNKALWKTLESETPEDSSPSESMEEKT